MKTVILFKESILKQNYYLVVGILYDYGMDAWSAACSIYDLFTIRILFPGNSNNQVGGYKLLDDTGLFESIWSIYRCFNTSQTWKKKKFPNKLIHKGAFKDQLSSNSFVDCEVYKITERVRGDFKFLSSDLWEKHLWRT